MDDSNNSPVEALARAMCALPHHLAGRPLALAISGGLDSICLMEAAARMRERRPEFRDALVLHLDHGLRAESADDAAFVTKEAEKRGFEVHSKKIDLRSRHQQLGGSLETLARQERYAFFLSVAGLEGLGLVITAHHADDQAETVAMSLLRGTHALGLAGIPHLRRIFAGSEIFTLRPLLEFSREDLRLWAEDCHLFWREDSSNTDLKHQRNFVRHALLPILESGTATKTDDSAPDGDRGHALLDLAIKAQAANRRLEACAARLIEHILIETKVSEFRHVFSLPLAALADYPSELVHRMICICQRRLDDRAQPPSPAMIQELLADDQDNYFFELDRHWHLGLDIDQEVKALVLRWTGLDETPTVAELSIHDAGSYNLFDASELILAEQEIYSPSHSPAEQWLHKSVIKGPLRIRIPQQGERMQPFGMVGRKLVADLLREAKIPREKRWRVPVVADDEGILWIPQIRASERCRITTPNGPFLRLFHVAPQGS